ncbi:MAG: hypothetical protein ACLUIR_05760 [Faecalibacterium prausnitzii]
MYGIAPTLDELYPDEERPRAAGAQKEAYEREMAFYNCTWTSAFTLGLALPWRSSTPPTVRTSTRRPSTPSKPR